MAPPAFAQALSVPAGPDDGDRRPSTPPAARTSTPAAGGGLTLGTAAGRWVLLAAVLGSGIAGIDASVVNVALPAIGTDLDAGFASLQWTVSAYALTLAAFILLGGTLGDRFGRRRVFLVGVIWFAAASLLCGIALDVPLLIVARAVQGVGAALLVPGSLAILQASFAPSDRGRAIGAWSGLGGVATAIGPLLGGWLVEIASWRLVFLINLPLAAVVVWLGVRHVPESRDPEAVGTTVDWTGGLLAAVTLGALTFALIEARGDTARLVAASVVAVVAAAGFVVCERRASHPTLPFGVFGETQFVAVNAVTMVVYAGFSVLFFLLVVALQVVAGFGPIAAGASLLPVTALMLLGSSRSGDLAARIGPRPQLTIGPLLCAAALLLLSGVDTDTTYLTGVLPGVVCFGLGVTVMVAPLTATALAAAPTEHAGLASGVNNAVARTGGLLAVAAVPALAGLTGLTDVGGHPDPSAFQHGYQHALWIAAGIVVAGAALAAATVRKDVLDGE